VSEIRPGLETEPVPDGSLAPSPVVIHRARPSEPVKAPVTEIRFGRFRADAKLGAGAMGTVYQAYDDVLGRAVAIKTLHTTDLIGIRERFLQEARAIGAVHHPNILAVHDAGTEGDSPYLVMELAPGGSLRERIKAGPLPVDTVRQIGIQIARALVAAHAVGILHRDVKPANILCTRDGTWKLADFGIARLPDSSLTITGQFLGSPSYAAPEALRAGAFSPASDVYGVGATLYEALTGSPPYGLHDMQSLIRKLEQEPPPLRSWPAIPGPLGDAIMSTLARDPSKRPSADQLAHLLAASDRVDAAVATRAPGWTRTRSLAIGGVLAAALLIIIAASRARSPATSSLTAPAAATDTHRDAIPPSAPGDSSADHAAPTETRPMVVDEYGNPVDEETARRVLEELERDDRHDRDEPPSRGRGRKKHKDRRD
jgi:eukaryotic-like serine/threonine-protein kinase